MEYLMIHNKMVFAVKTTPAKVSTKTRKARVQFVLGEGDDTDYGSVSFGLHRESPDQDWKMSDIIHYEIDAKASEIVDALRVGPARARQVWNKTDISEVAANPAIYAQRLVKSTKVRQVLADMTTRIPDKVDETLINYAWNHDGHDYSVYAENADSAARAITLALFDSGNREARIAFMDAGEADALEVQTTGNGLEKHRVQNVLSRIGLEVDAVTDPERVAANKRSKVWNDKKRAEKAAAKANATATATATATDPE